LLPIELKWLYCEYNELTKLPLLPIELKWLFWQNNKLIELPLLLNRLIGLDHYENEFPKLLILGTTDHNTTLLLRLKSGIDEFSNLTLHPDLKNAIIEEAETYYSHFIG